MSPAVADKGEGGVLDPLATLALSPAVTDEGEPGVLDPLAVMRILICWHAGSTGHAPGTRVDRT